MNADSIVSAVRFAYGAVSEVGHGEIRSMERATVDSLLLRSALRRRVSRGIPAGLPLFFSKMKQEKTSHDAH